MPASLDRVLTDGRPEELSGALKARYEKMTPTGLEPEACSPQKTPVSNQRDAQSNALLADDERLRVLLEAWADLPESVKTAVMEMVRG